MRTARIFPWPLSGRFIVELSALQRYLKLVRRGEGLEAKAHGGGKPAKLTPERLEQVEALIAANSDATLVELCELVSTQEKVQVSRSTMGRLTQSLGFSRKKTLHASERNTSESKS